MTQDNWQDCPTFESVAEAKKRGDYIEYITDEENYKYEEFKPWDTSKGWFSTYEFRCRPAKPKTKTVVFQELEITYAPWTFITVFVPKDFIIECRYTGNERIEEVPE